MPRISWTRLVQSLASCTSRADGKARAVLACIDGIRSLSAHHEAKAEADQLSLQDQATAIVDAMFEYSLETRKIKEMSITDKTDEPLSSADDDGQGALWLS